MTNKRNLMQLILVSLMVWLGAQAAFSQNGGTVLLDESLFKDDTFPDIEVMAAVINARGVPYQKLPKDAFEATEDGNPVKIKNVTEQVNDKVKISVLLAIDGSGSMGANNFEPWNKAKESAVKFLESLGADDQAALIVFGDSVNMDLPVSAHLDPVKEANFTTDKASLVAKIQALPNPVPGHTTTPLYDATYKALSLAEELKGESGRRAIILFTDGEQLDPHSSTERSDILPKVYKVGVPVFTIGLGNLIDVAYLKRLAADSGAEYFEATSAGDLITLYQKIYQQLKTEYKITFTSNIQADNKPHSLQITAMADSERHPSKPVQFKAHEPLIPGIQLEYDRHDNDKGVVAPTRTRLDDNFEIPTGDKYRQFNITPETSTRYQIQRVEYFIDKETKPFVSIISPFSYMWDMTKVASGTHKIRVVAYDNQTPAHKGETTITLRGGLLGSGKTVSPEPLPWFWIILVGLIILTAAAIYIRKQRTPPPQPVQPALPTPYYPPGGYLPAPPPTPMLTAPAPPLLPSGQGQNVIEGSFTAGGTAGNYGSSAFPGQASPMQPTANMNAPLGKPAFLVMQQGNRDGQQYPLAVENTIGRDGQSCNVVIEDGTVSSQHVQIKQEGNGLFQLYDMGSKNGTYVNNKRVQKARLEDGDKIELGRVVLVFKQTR